MALAVLLALAVDRWLGEPRAAFHPVVWIGNYLGWAGAWVQRQALQDPALVDLKAFWLAAAAWCAGAAVVLGVAWGLQHVLLALPFWLAVLGMGLLLKPLLAWAMLKNEICAVETALGQSLLAGRERLQWLVSRDVAVLDESGVRESAIESLAENLNDSVVAPLFWFLVLGLPGAAVYRFANTADAMWGYPGLYKGRNWAWAGKWAARADDVLSWVPARATAVLLLLVSSGFPLQKLRGEARRTPSPNSGWPMAAMALALDIRLRKPGVYTLNAPGHAPQRHHLGQAVRLANAVVGCTTVGATAALIALACLQPGGGF